MAISSANVVSEVSFKKKPIINVTIAQRTLLQTKKTQKIIKLKLIIRNIHPSSHPIWWVLISKLQDFFPLRLDI